MAKHDHTLENLLDLDGNRYVLDERGHWVKFDVKRISKPEKNRPHGIKYSLTLHNKKGDRILGYDNAHKIPGKADDTEYDHKHHIRHGKRVKEYNFETATKLMEDFWCDVDNFLNEE